VRSLPLILWSTEHEYKVGRKHAFGDQNVFHVKDHSDERVKVRTILIRQSVVQKSVELLHKRPVKWAFKHNVEVLPHDTNNVLGVHGFGRIDLDN